MTQSGAAALAAPTPFFSARPTIAQSPLQLSIEPRCAYRGKLLDTNGNVGGVDVAGTVAHEVNGVDEFTGILAKGPHRVTNSDAPSGTRCPCAVQVSPPVHQSHDPPQPFDPQTRAPRSGVHVGFFFFYFFRFFAPAFAARPSAPNSASMSPPRPRRDHFPAATCVNRSKRLSFVT